MCVCVCVICYGGVCIVPRNGYEYIYSYDLHLRVRVKRRLEQGKGVLRSAVR